MTTQQILLVAGGSLFTIGLVALRLDPDRLPKTTQHLYALVAKKWEPGLPRWGWEQAAAYQRLFNFLL